jgi:hypothetical protein
MIESSCVRETQRKKGMDATVDYKSPDTFYRGGRGDGTVEEKQSTASEVRYSMHLFRGEERKGQRPF